MRGDLTRTSAADACRDLARQAATGLLAIEGPDGPGSVSMVDGRVVAASSPTPRARLGDRLVGASYLDEQDLAEALRLQRTGEGHARLGVLLVDRGLVSRDAVRLFIQEQLLDALFDVLRWRYGSFEFIHGEATEVLEIPLSLAVDDVLVEVARRQQEWEQVSQLIPDLEAVPNFRAGASSAAASLEPDEFAVLASVDGERSVRTLANDLGYGEFEAARIIYGLCLLGIVEIQLPEDEVGAAFDDAFSDPADDDDPSATPTDVASDDDARAEVSPELSSLLSDLASGRDAAASDLQPDDPVGVDDELGHDEVPDEHQEARRHEPEPWSSAGPSGVDEPAPASDAPAADTTGELELDWAELAAEFDLDDEAGPEPSAVDTPPHEPEPTEHEPYAVDGPPLPAPPPPVVDASEPAPEPAPEPAAEHVSGEASEPAAEPSAEPAPEPADEPPPEPASEPGPEPASDPDPEPEEGVESAPPSAGGDVSEFLRELSRLALDDGDDAKPTSVAKRPTSRPSVPREDEKPKKRGLFGWGS